jgi:hypothetical protein
VIRQRFLYVGIGGSGLDIGRELTEALTREVCGLDGRRLQARGGAFAGFSRNELPKFIQSVYLDFSQQALDEINTHLQGKNATAIHTILPPFNSFVEAGTYLKNQKVPGVEAWIPEDPTVNVAPLSGGAGQYPTVGRAALFASLKRQGYAQSIGNKLGRALDELAQSMGQLTAFAGNGVYTNSIAVYLGFSLSGGTGCGIFYDVIHLLYNELTTRFPDVPCVIMPVIIMPSLFDSVLVGVNKRNTQLNAATALLDLSRLMDLFNNPDAELAALRVVHYPWSSVDGAGGYKAINLDTQFGRTAVKVATLVDRRGGLDRKDVYRSIASAIVSQVSTVATVNQMTMGFVDKLVNDNEIRDMHHTLLGRKNIMPSVSASLTLPSERLVEVISQRLLADGLRAQLEAVPSRSVVEDQVNSFLNGSGQGQIVEPQLFSERVDVRFTVPAGALGDSKKYEQFQGNVQRKVVQSLEDLKPLVKQSIPEMQDVRVIEGLIKVLDSYEDRNIFDALEIAGRALAALRGQRFADEAAPVRGKKKSNKLFGLFGGKPDRTAADRWLKLQEEKYKQDVEDLWWTEWDARKILWQSNVEESDRLLQQVRHWLDEQGSTADREMQKEITRLNQTTLGVVEYLPSATGNMEQTLITLINGVRDKIRERLDINETDSGTLVTKVMRANQRNAWGDSLRKYMNEREPGLFIESLLEPMRTAVQDVLQDVLTPLSDSLSALANAPAGALSPDLDQLQEKLASLLPDGVIPQTQGAKPRVLVTYPGKEDQRVVEYLKNIIFGSRFEGMNRNEVFQFAAAPDSGSITATINIVGQGLLDSEEVRALLATWVEANRPNVSQPATDRLMFRQRISFENLQDITDVPNRRVILRNFLAALYDGHVTIQKGTIESPEEIRVTKSGTNAHFDIPLWSRDGASPWASLYNGFEEKIVTASSLTNPGLPDAIKWFGEYVPSCLNLIGEKPQVPAPLFESLIELVSAYERRRDEMQHPPGLNKSAIKQREAVFKFWTQDITESLTAPYLNNLNTSFWCIGAAYVGSGRSESMRVKLGEIIVKKDEKIRQAIEDERQRQRAAVANLG